MKSSPVSLALSLLCVGSPWTATLGFTSPSTNTNTDTCSSTSTISRTRTRCLLPTTLESKMRAAFPFSLQMDMPRHSVRRRSLGEFRAVLSMTKFRLGQRQRPFSLQAIPSDSDVPSSQSNNSTASELSQGSTLATGTSSSAHVTETSQLPSYRKLIVFTLTTILIWISEPLLSLVDTAIVGMTTSSKSAVLQVAALGPATTLYDSSIYMTYFLAIAATNLISPALAQKNWKQLRTSTSHLMGLAVVFGTLVSAIAYGMGKSIITSMVGTSFINQEIIPLATTYAMIRATVAPFCVVDFVAQSFCLATLDTVTPTVAVAVASLVNIVGDLILTPRWGIQGAAVATAMATVSSSLILVRKVRKQTHKWKVLQEREEAQASLLSFNSKSIGEATPSVNDYSFPRPLKTQVVNGSIEMIDDNKDRPFGAPRTKKINGAAIQDIPFWSLPDKKSLVDLLKLAGPIFFVMIGKIACYSILTVRATSFGIIPLAAHNIMMRVFFFFACFGDSLSQATQTFFPQVKLEQRGQLIKRLLYLSAAVGFFISQFSYFILSRLGGFLTKDAAIIQQMAQYAPYAASAVLLHPFIMLLEGTVLARRDLLALVGIYISTMTLHFGMVFLPSTFGGLWLVFFTFQAIRLVQFAGRVLWKSREEPKQTSPASTILS